MRCKPGVFIALCAMLSFILSGCGSTGSQSETSTQSPAPGGNNAGSAPSGSTQPGGSNSGGTGSTSGGGSGSGSGSGTGTTQPGWAESKSSLGFAGRVLTADFNHDGRPDLLVYSSGLAVLLNSGSGSFTSAISSALPAGASAIVQVALADLNGDGFTDVAACTAGGSGTTGSAAVYLNDHSGKLILGQVITLPAACKGIAAGDANHDGKADLSIGYYTGTFSAPSNVVATWFGDGAGQFANPVTQTIALTATQDPTKNPCSLAAATGADFDGNGTLDLLLFGTCQADVINPGDIYLAKGDGTGHYALTELGESFTTVSGSPYLQDVNGDGKLDVVYTQEQYGPHGSDGTDINYAINSGAGFTLTRATSESAYAGDGTWITAGAPLNGTGTALEGFHTESAMSNPSTYGVKLFNDVKSSPAQTWIYGQSTTSVAPGVVQGIASADFDGNGMQDFVAVEEDANHTATLHVYLHH